MLIKEGSFLCKDHSHQLGKPVHPLTSVDGTQDSWSTPCWHLEVGLGSAIHLSCWVLGPHDHGLSPPGTPSTRLFLSRGSGGPNSLSEDLLPVRPDLGFPCWPVPLLKFAVCTPGEALTGPGPAWEPGGSGCRSPAWAWRGCPGPVSSLSQPLGRAGVGLGSLPTASVGSLGRGPVGSAGISALEGVRGPEGGISLSPCGHRLPRQRKALFPTRTGFLPTPSIFHPHTCS